MVYKSNILSHTQRNVLKFGTLLVCLFACVGTYAGDTVYAKSKWMDDYPKHVGLTYTVGADVVSNYIWRGIQVAGLGVQPDLAVGYGGAYLDVWASMNATDWTFQTPSVATGNAFYPELDVSIGFCRWGLDVKYMAMYYFTGWGNYTQEWRVKYRVSNKLPLHVMWCTRTWGKDGYILDKAGNLVFPGKYIEMPQNQQDSCTINRAYSSYIELGYEFALPYEMTLFANLGMTPWKSFYTLYQGEFAVVNMHLKLQRSWELSKHCLMNVFGELMINPYDLSRMTVDDTYISINGGQQCLWNIGCGFYLK